MHLHSNSRIKELFTNIVEVLNSMMARECSLHKEPRISTDGERQHIAETFSSWSWNSSVFIELRNGCSSTQNSKRLSSQSTRYEPDRVSLVTSILQQPGELSPNLLWEAVAFKHLSFILCCGQRSDLLWEYSDALSFVVSLICTRASKTIQRKKSEFINRSANRNTLMDEARGKHLSIFPEMVIGLLSKAWGLSSSTILFLLEFCCCLFTSKSSLC